MEYARYGLFTFFLDRELSNEQGKGQKNSMAAAGKAGMNGRWEYAQGQTLQPCRSSKAKAA